MVYAQVAIFNDLNNNSVKNNGSTANDLRNPFANDLTEDLLTSRVVRTA
jgi:hypothetical protein